MQITCLANLKFTQEIKSLQAKRIYISAGTIQSWKSGKLEKEKGRHGMLHASVSNKFDKLISLSSALHKKVRGKDELMCSSNPHSPPAVPTFPAALPSSSMSHHLLASAFQRIGIASHASLKVENREGRGRDWHRDRGILKTRGNPSVGIYCQLAAPHSKAINFLLDYIKFTNDLSMPSATSVSPPSNPISSSLHFPFLPSRLRFPFPYPHFPTRI